VPASRRARAASEQAERKRLLADEPGTPTMAMAMKMGPVRSRWRYDAAARHTGSIANAWSRSIFSLRLIAQIPLGSACVTDAPQAFDPMLLVSSDLTSNRSCLTESQVRY
jgi:hypothetical protein